MTTRHFDLFSCLIVTSLSCLSISTSALLLFPRNLPGHDKIIATPSTLIPSAAAAAIQKQRQSLQEQHESSKQCRLLDVIKCAFPHDDVRIVLPPHKISNERIQPSANESANNVCRKSFLTGLARTASLTLLLSDQDPSIDYPYRPKPVAAMENPLNLKGTFWETGQLYEKKSSAEALPQMDDSITAEWLRLLETTLQSLRSPSLVNAVTEGRFGDASRMLRGGLVSESKIRIAAYALMDSIPEEEDDRLYLANEAFRVFLRRLDVLDAIVEMASRPLVWREMGGREDEDPRLKALGLLGEVEESLMVFLNIIMQESGEGKG